MKNKTAIITGISKGLGIAFTKKFQQKGFFVIGISRSKPPTPPDLWIQGDLTKPQERQKIIQQIKNSKRKIHILFNNAGVGAYETWEKLEEQSLRQLFELNFFSIVSLTNACIPLLKQTQGTIINTSSIAGELYVPCMGAYCASKAALTFYSNSLRAELSPKNIHVLNLIVGRINTGFSSRSYGSKQTPDTPGSSGDAQKLADKVYEAYQKQKRSITYPAWYTAAALFAKTFPKFYDRENRKRWKL